MKTEQLKEKKLRWTCRDTLWYMVFLGFGINYMIRININIAIVSMVKHRPKTNLTLTSECIAMEAFRLTEEAKSGFNDTLLLDDVSSSTMIPVNPVAQKEGTFDWDEHQQGIILGSFYYLHWVTQLPGGILAAKYGTKKVFGISNFLGCALCFLIPAASNMGYIWLVLLRVLQGFITGFTWPAMHHMTAKWIPPNERSKFVTAYLGNSFGVGMTFIICGWILAHWSWEPVFHVCGLIGCVWYAAWVFLVFDTPADHPRITETERMYISQSLGCSVSKERKSIPWKDILTSVPVWLNTAAQFGGIWGLFTSMTYAPMYFKLIHGWNMKATGVLSGLPHFGRVTWAYLFSMCGDYLLRSKKMTRTNVRKLATFFSCSLHGVFLLLMAYSGCNYTAAVVFLTLAATSHGAVSTGSLASFVDISPNYASILLGISGMISVLPGFISPAIVGELTYNNQTVGQWQKVFWVAAFMLIVPGILYQLFAKSELESWNDPRKAIDIVLEEEMKKLNKDGKEEVETIKETEEKT